MRNWLIIGIILCFQPAFSQSYSFKKKQSAQKGAMYFYWGYNRSIYTKSNIQFTGENYDFTVIKAKAHDNPSTELQTYVNLKMISIPQFNIRLGYYFKHKWDVSFGYDHMKYVMADYQDATLDGYIDPSANNYLSGQFDQQIYTLTPNMIHYENSNGLNYISVQINHTKSLYRTHSRKIRLQRRLGVGLGGVVTQTDFRWSGIEYHTKLKPSGAGASVHTGLRLDFFNRLFLQSNWSSGIIYLPKVQTIADTKNYASQKFIYADWQLLGGISLYLRTKNDCGSCPDW